MSYLPTGPSLGPKFEVILLTTSLYSNEISKKVLYSAHRPAVAQTTVAWSDWEYCYLVGVGGILHLKLPSSFLSGCPKSSLAGNHNDALDWIGAHCSFVLSEETTEYSDFGRLALDPRLFHQKSSAATLTKPLRLLVWNRRETLMKSGKVQLTHLIHPSVHGDVLTSRTLLIRKRKHVL